MPISKTLAFTLFAFLLLCMACGGDDDMTEDKQDEANMEESTCSAEPFGISLDTPNVSFQQDSSWLTFNDGPNIVGDRLGYLGWDYPGWMGSSDLVFSYPNGGLAVGEYEITSAGGVLYFDGSGGTMLVCPCEGFFLEISHLDKSQGYCCGVVSGMATNQNDELVSVQGSFKAFLDGE